MPVWALLTLALLQEAPTFAATLDLANAPEADAATMAQLKAARDQAIADYETAIGVTPAKGTTINP